MNKIYFKGLLLLTIIILGATTVKAQNKQQINQIRQNYNLVNLKIIKEDFQKKSSSQKQNAIRIAKDKGWDLRKTLPNGRLIELQKVVNGKPIYYTTFNDDAAKSTRTNFLHNEGGLGLNLLGQEMTAHVWDGGLARSTHQEYDGGGGTNRFSIGDGSTTLHYHSAHVTGTIIASGVKANAKGMAPYADAIGYDWNNDKAEATAAATNGMLVSNHSYGYAARNSNGAVQLPIYYFGAYIDESRDWDEIMFNAPNYLMVIAAGNDGDDNTANSNPLGGNNLFDKLTGHATSKNNMVVANAQDANIDASGNLISVSINSSSSEGPTDDLRIKPDITGNGTNVYSTYDSSDDAYNSITGTSMASPGVAGSLLLLQQHYKNINGIFMKAATLKGLALHTADDAGVAGPDAIFGWGLLNAKRSAETITERGTNSIVDELTLNQGQSYTINVSSDGSSPLLASISWTDHPGTANTGTENLSTPVLVNDLDIRITKNETTYMPYKLTGVATNTQADNNVDPYERVNIVNASGEYTITVTHKGSLTDNLQNFSLVVTGITEEATVCTATVPTGVSVSNITNSEANVNWTAIDGATYNVRYRKTGTTDWSTNTVSETTSTLSTLSASTEYEVQVRSNCTDNSSDYSASVNFTTIEIQLNYCESKGNNVSDEYIQNVKFGTIDNTSTGGNGYSDYTSISTDLTKGNSYTITITPKWTGTIYDEGYGVWIDYNKDGDFSDSGEQVWTKDKSKTNPVSTSFTIPESADEGATKMRVILSYNKIPSVCGTYDYGETEDYTVNISASVPDTEAPTAPTNLTAAKVEQTTLSLNWVASTDNVKVTGYNVYKGSTKIISPTSNTAEVTGLTAATNYTFYVKALDATGNESATSNVINVTTANNQIDYCKSSGNRTTYEWIDYVSFGGMSNTTIADGGYGDYTSKVATVTKGSTSKIVFSAGFNSSAYTEFWTLWIDYNHDGTFDTNEKVASGSSSSSDNLSADITIPSDAVLGNTRMRISMKYNSEQTACESFEDGEVEDYTVNIIEDNVNSNSNSISDSYAKPLGYEIAEQVDIFPNPASDFIQVRLANSKNLSYEIISHTGQVVKSGSVGDGKIIVASLKSGIYLININDGQKIVSTKLIKE